MAHQLNLVAGLYSFGRCVRACLLPAHAWVPASVLACPPLSHHAWNAHPQDAQPPRAQVVEGDLVQSAKVDLAAPCALAHPLLSFPRSAGLGGVVVW